VKWFSTVKGFGFISQPQGADAFVHITALAPGVRDLAENQAVEYDVEQGQKGPQAVNVRPV
jgi:CspA family cold shock protein